MTSGGDDQKRTNAVKLYTRAKDAAKKNNFDYAIELYQDALKLMPDNLQFRQELRDTERKKYKDNKKGDWKAGLTTQGTKLALRTAMRKHDFQEALLQAEKVLAKNPWDTGTLIEQAEACEKLNYNEVARWTLEHALEKDSDDVAVLRPLALLYEKIGEYKLAIACWQRIEKQRPNDEEVRDKLKDLEVNRAILQAGFGRADSAKGPNHEAAKSGGAKPAAEPPAQPEVSPEQRLRDQIEAEPANVTAYLQLARLYRSQGDFPKADAVFKQALDASGNDFEIQVERAELHIDYLRQNIALAEQKAAQGDAEAKAQAEKLGEQLAKLELDFYRKRSARYPEDPELHKELGLRLARLGLYKEAIPELQKARSGHLVRPYLTLLTLGECFEATRNLKLAQRTYTDALDATPASETDTRKELNYRLGCVAQALNQTAEAENFFNEVAAIDYAYKDVAQRLEKLAEGG